MHLFVALDDMDVHLPEIAVILLQYTVCLLQEPSDKVPRAGHGCVDHDSEIRDLPYLPRLLRLNQRHVSVDGQPVGVVDGVELGLALPDHGAAGHELAQERAVVVSPAVAYPEDRHQRTGPPFVVPDEALHLGHDLLGELPPDGVVKGPAVGVVVPDEHLPVGL